MSIKNQRLKDVMTSAQKQLRRDNLARLKRGESVTLCPYDIDCVAQTCIKCEGAIRGLCLVCWSDMSMELEHYCCCSNEDSEENSEENSEEKSSD